MPTKEKHNQERLLTGDRPTGKLHLGHFVGSISNRVRLQREYECYFIIADLHTLTTRPEKETITQIPDHIREMVLDYLAAGIESESNVFYLQSAVPAVYELNLIFEMLVTAARLQRIPSLKDMARAANLENMPFGLLGYPILQAADILMVRASIVPVGQDNAAHVELSREISRRFNNLYGDVFPEPELLLSEIPILKGTDGAAKMSKSAGNAIFLSDDADAVERKVTRMYTDPKRTRPDIPGTVEGNPVFMYHDAFNPNREEIQDLKQRYRKGKVGDVEVKQKLSIALNSFLEPMRARRASYEQKPGFVDDLIKEGTRKAIREASETLAIVKDAMGLSYSKRFI